MTNYQWWRQRSAKAPRRLHEATTVAPRATTEAPRTLHEAAAKPSQPPRLHEGFMKPPRSLRNHGGSTKAPSRLHESSTKAPRSNRGSAGVSIKWMRREGIMERSRGLRGASVVALGATMVASWSLRWSLRGALAPPWFAEEEVIYRGWAVRVIYS